MYVEHEDTDSDYDDSGDALSMDSALAAEWQYREEIAYQERLAMSLPPGNVKAIFAANWLRGQGVW